MNAHFAMVFGANLAHKPLPLRAKVGALVTPSRVLEICDRRAVILTLFRLEYPHPEGAVRLGSDVRMRFREFLCDPALSRNG
jgi:hypothetical protein